MKKHKKLLRAAAALMAAAVVCAALPAHSAQAQGGKSSELYNDIGLPAYSYTEVSGGIAITEYHGFSQELRVPDTIDGKKVVEIKALEAPDGVVSVTVPGSVKKAYGIGGNTLLKITFEEGVEEIGSMGHGEYDWRSIRGESLREVVLPSSLKRIDDNAFECCGLEKVNIPDGAEIGDSAFYLCSGLECPDDDVVRRGGLNAFKGTCGYGYSERTTTENGCEIFAGRLVGCTSKAVKLVIPEGVEYIECDLYDDHDSRSAGCYFQEVVLPESLKVVTGFDGCPELQKVTFLGAPEEINTFNKCPSLTEIVIPEGVKRVKGFEECVSLRSADIAGSVEELCAFEECTSLETVTFHEGSLRVIGEDSFGECEMLDNVELPAPLEEIGEYAFMGCKSLKNITFPDTLYRVYYDFEDTPWYYEQPLGEQLYIGSCFMGYPYDYYEDYPESYTLKKGTKGISVKYGIQGLKDLPDTLKFVDCIYGYTGSDLILPEGLEYIANNAQLRGENAYGTVVIPASVKTIDFNMLGFECDRLVFKGCPEYIGYSDYEAFPDIKSVELPDSFGAFTVVSLPDDGSFFLANEYGRMLWLDSVQTKNITAEMLEGVNYLNVSSGSIETITLPASVRQLDISNMSELKSVKLTSSVRRVVCNNCPKLTSLELPNGVSSILTWDMTSLKTISAPDSLIIAEMNGDSQWLASQPDGPVYLGKCLVGYKGEMPDNYKLTVPEGINSICGFPENDKLTELTLPSSCRYAAGFEDCYALKKLDTGGTAYIAKDTFADAPITELTLGDNCRYIGSSAFFCTVLDTIRFSKNMEYVGPANFDAKKAYVPKTMHTADSLCELDGTAFSTRAEHVSIWGTAVPMFNTNNDDTPTICGYRGTAHEAYAESFGYDFKDIENESIDWGKDFVPYPDLGGGDTKPPVQTDTDKHSDSDTKPPVQTDTDKHSDSDTKPPVQTDTDKHSDSDTKPPVQTDTDKPSDLTGASLYGDLDGDGLITANDALIVLRASIGLETLTAEQTRLADIDSDAAVTSSDALEVLRYSVGLAANEKIGKAA